MSVTGADVPSRAMGCDIVQQSMVWMCSSWCVELFAGAIVVWSIPFHLQVLASPESHLEPISWHCAKRIAAQDIYIMSWRGLCCNLPMPARSTRHRANTSELRLTQEHPPVHLRHPHRVQRLETCCRFQQNPSACIDVHTSDDSCICEQNQVVVGSLA